MDAAALRRHAAQFVGVPFLDHGRTPATGWDCWGLWRHVGASAGLGVLPDYGESYDRADGEGAQKVAAAIDLYLGSWRRLSAPRPGSMLVFRRFGRAFHVGFALDRCEMLHVHRGAIGGTVIERFDGLVWGRLLDGAFLPGSFVGD